MGRWWLLALVPAAVGVVWWIYPSTDSTDPGNPAPEVPHVEIQLRPVAPPVLSGPELLRQEVLANLAVLPGQSYPASLPWSSLQQLGARGAVPLEHLRHACPLEFLDLCLDRYERDVRSYKLTFLKRERVAGKLYPPEGKGFEKMQVHFREKPFSVHMAWLANAHLAQKVLYVEGENDGQMVVRPHGKLLSAFVVSREVRGPDARSSGRYTIDQFGLYLAQKRTVDRMREAARRGALHLEYQGLVKLGEVGGRACYKFLRKPYQPPEDDNISELTVYIDAETWLQVGSVLRDPDGKLIAEYYFRDVEINPDIDKQQFTRGAV